MTHTALVLLLVNILAIASTNAGDDILIADFEGDEFGDWQVSGDAFGKGPAKGTLQGQMQVSGFMGKRLVNSFYGGDGTTGTLTSPEFTLERTYINFLIGGGGHADKTCMNLLVDGAVVRTATGLNTEPGGSEALRWQSWDVTELKGKNAYIQIVDNHTGGWGHINVDHIIQSNERVSPEKTREIVVEKKLLNLPVQNGAPKTWFRLLDGEKILREFDIELAESSEQTDFWVTIDLTEFMGKRITLWVDNVLPNSQGFNMVCQEDKLIGGENLYREKYRPQFHFSPQRGWTNDPNGMVYYDGEYHLFFQHNPYGWNWGNMTWGHAVSKDMVHWEELGDAIHPDEHGTIFSGSAVVDWNNTTGFQTGDDPPLVCIFTYAGDNNLSSKGVKFTQGIAYSNDRGRTWTKYEGNPVQGHIIGGNRDPKVIWHEPTKQWVIVLFLDKQRAAFFTSKNLKEWTLSQEMDALFECPEFFELPVNGSIDDKKWVLYGASGDYYVGQFDGKEYKPDGVAVQFNYGDSFYASQTFNDIPPEDGRRIQIAWGRSGHKDMPFNQMMNFPVELTLRNTPDGLRMYAWPVREIESLYNETHTWKNTTVEETNNIFKNIKGDLFDITVVFETKGNAGKFGITVRDLTLRYDVRKQQLRCKDKEAALKPEAGKVALRLLVDRSSVEIFGNNGLLYMPMSHICENDDAAIEILPRFGDVNIVELTVHELASAWEQGKQGAYAADAP